MKKIPYGLADYKDIKEEFENWKSQIVTSNSGKMGLRDNIISFNFYLEMLDE